MLKPFISAAMAAITVSAICSCNREPEFARTEELGPYTVSLIEEDVWHVEDCNASNPHGQSVKEDGTPSFNNCSDMYIIRGRDRILLIDLSNRITWAEDADSALVKIICDRAEGRPLSVFVTHNHFDHVGMLPAIAGLDNVVFLLPEHDFADDSSFPSEKTRLVADGDRIELGGMSLELVEVPGHTPGSMTAFLKGHDMAFSGDAIGSGNGVWLLTPESFSNYVRGLENLNAYIKNPDKGIKPDKLVFHGGHDWQKGDMEALDYQYFEDMLSLVDRMLKGEVEPEDYNIGRAYLNANFRYGTAAITWNADDGRAVGANSSPCELRSMP